MSASISNEDEPAFEWGQLQEIVITPLIIRRGAVPPSGQSRTSTHPFYTWWWVERGWVQLDCAGCLSRVSAGRWVLIPCGRKRRQRFSPQAQILSINLDVRWASGLSVLTLAEPLIGTKTTALELVELAERICSRMAKRATGDKHSLEHARLSFAEGLELRANLNRFVLLLFSCAAQQGAHVGLHFHLDKRLQEVLRDLRDRLSAGPLPYQDWQSSFGLGRVQLDRLARAQLHRSLRQFRDDLLVAEAYRRLARTNVVVKAVAAELGFVDTAHFCRWMRRHTGHSPSELRQLGVA